MIIFLIAWWLMTKRNGMKQDKPARFVIILSCVFIFFLPLAAVAGIVAGDPRGQVTLVDFFDYTCPHCQNMEPIVKELMAVNPHLRVIYRPLPFLGPGALFATRMVFAAQKQKSFFVLHDALLNAHTELTPQAIVQIANAEGFNTQQLSTDINSLQVKQEVAENIEVAKQLNIQVLPTLIIGASNATSPSAVFYGETSFEKLQQALVQVNQPSG
jgi:protein-disulfide isomerase